MHGITAIQVNALFETDGIINYLFGMNYVFVLHFNGLTFICWD